MADSILSYDNRRRFVVRTWAKGEKYSADNVVVHSNRIYYVNYDFTSGNSNPAVYVGGALTRMDERYLAPSYRDIGPYAASAGYYQVSEGRDTSYRLSSHTVNEVVIGFAPHGYAADNGDWTDGGRVTVRYGFTLRVKKINTVD